MIKYVVDTSVLIHDIKVLDVFSDIAIPTLVLEELDGLKKAEGDLGRKARSAIREIRKNKYKLQFITKDSYQNIGDLGWDLTKRDNLIVLAAGLHEATLLTNDINMEIKAESIGISSKAYKSIQEAYTGIKSLYLSTNDITDLYNGVWEGSNKYGLVENQYVIINDTTELRYVKGDLVPLKLPNHIKGLNSEQRCALDMLYNPNITIKIVLGGYGSGKTYLSTKYAIDAVKTSGAYSKILCVREPVGEGKDIGFLPGTKEDKTSDFFKPIEQSLAGGEFELAEMVKHGQLEKDIPFFLKGTTWNNTLILCDEAEDIKYKQLKMIGTRLGKNSSILLIGDYKQSIYQAGLDNDLLKMATLLKGNSKVGVVTLDEDVRSDESRIFASLP